MRYLVLPTALGLSAALACLACSSEDEKAPRTREQFCRDWANAACSADTVSACQATTPEACHLRQQEFCSTLVPQNFSDKAADACLTAVSNAYADADLTGDELTTVLRLGGPCSNVVRGPKGRGETCMEDRECNGAEGFRCVMRGELTQGTCQVPEKVGPGERCAAAQQVCDDGFYCDGKNCIAVKEEGEDCANDYECGTEAKCWTGNQCMPRLLVGGVCVTNEECASGLCYTVNGSSTCADRIRLSPAEPLCENLR